MRTGKEANQFGRCTFNRLQIKSPLLLVDMFIQLEVQLVPLDVTLRLYDVIYFTTSK